jgi:hypothetical protein
MYLVATLEIATAEIMAKDGILLWWVGTKLAVKWRARITLACRKRRIVEAMNTTCAFLCFGGYRTIRAKICL